MKYYNRLPKEGVNTPQRHPLTEFLRLTVAAIVALLLFVLLLNSAGGRLGGLIPFRVELWVAQRLDDAFAQSGVESPFSSRASETELIRYLTQLGRQVEQALGMSAPMVVKLHYSDEDTFNAYATLGGHVTLYKGLLKELPHENALVMLMAHEYSHVQLRHTARGVGGGLAVAVGAALLPGGSGVEGRLYSISSLVSNLNFSRSMETEADQNALHAVHQIYGHVNGAADLFGLFVKFRGVDKDGKLDRFFSTHPLDAQRIGSISQSAMEQGWALEGSLTGLPADFQQWLNATR